MSMASPVAQLADRLAHVAEQQLGQRMGLADVLLRLAFGEVAGDFQVQAQRGEVVAEQVVQLARDAGALVDARAFGQQRAGGAQLGVEPALLVARLGLLPGDQAGDEDEAREAGIQERLHQRLDHRELEPAREHRQERKPAQHQPDHAQRQRQQPRQHARR